jgi:hypothetical protein
MIETGRKETAVDKAYLEDLAPGQVFTSQARAVVGAGAIKRFAGEFDPQPWPFERGGAFSCLEFGSKRAPGRDWSGLRCRASTAGSSARGAWVDQNGRHGLPAADGEWDFECARGASRSAMAGLEPPHQESCAIGPTAIVRRKKWQQSVRRTPSRRVHDLPSSQGTTAVKPAGTQIPDAEVRCENRSKRRGTAAFRRYGFVSVCGIWHS